MRCFHSSAMTSAAIAKLVTRSSIRVAALGFAYMVAARLPWSVVGITAAALPLWPYLVVFAFTGLAFDLATGSWRKSWRFTSLKDVLVLSRAATLIALVLLFAVFMLDRGEDLPRSALFLAWVLDIGLFGGLLLLRRALHEQTLLSALAPFLYRSSRPRVPLVLIGRLEAADTILRELERDGSSAYAPVGVITAHPADLRHEVRGVRVVATLGAVDAFFARFVSGEGERAVLFLHGEISPADLDGELLAKLRERGVHLLRQNRIASVDAPQGRLALRELDFNELLARPPVELDLERMRALVVGKRVLVTGAGGSIGSEICRQVAQLSAAHLGMIDHSEFGIFKIDQEIAAAHPGLSRRARLCDVRDGARVRGFIAAEAPELVFHAAALKHVPLMEDHAADAALTNVVGSANVADAAVAAGARNCVFISTDKAVNPPNVMGATKRLAERVVCQRRATGQTKINVVRFGNVLGSAGSVVPTFVAQIENGGPVTLTHPDIERFFMTIPEAVQLVLHATALAEVEDIEGVIVLDMGEPVKIVDLARRLIELHGKTPGVDIEIKVTGLRPGEKMTEALFDVTEAMSACGAGVLHVVDSNQHVRITDLELQQMEASARAGLDDEVREQIFRILQMLRTPMAADRDAHDAPLTEVGIH